MALKLDSAAVFPRLFKHTACRSTHFRGTSWTPILLDAGNSQVRVENKGPVVSDGSYLIAWYNILSIPISQYVTHAHSSQILPLGFIYR